MIFFAATLEIPRPLSARDQAISDRRFPVCPAIVSAMALRVMAGWASTSAFNPTNSRSVTGPVRLPRPFLGESPMLASLDESGFSRLDGKSS